ncbi:MAG: hypothetical protein K8S20_13745 [Chloroflexi bacterium]|nr:hypothetical protein [Chloroflexota bacterium]
MVSIEIQFNRVCQMNILRFLFRMGFSVLIAFSASFSSAVIFFDYTGYRQASDRAFLVGVPALAIAFLLFGSFPRLWDWLAQRHKDVLVGLAVAALLVAGIVGLPFAVSRVYYLGMFSFAVVLYALMLPAVPAIERQRTARFLCNYFFGFIFSLVFVYGVIGALNNVLSGGFQVLVFSTVLSMLGILTGYYLVRRAIHSFQNGFLHNILNILLTLILPFFLIVIIKILVLFPAMFHMSYIQMPASWLGLFLPAAVVAGVWGIPVLEQFESRGFYILLRQTRLFAFFKENLPGIYAGAMFSMVNFVMARALNHPTFSINSLLFRADSGLWLTILGYPEGGRVERSVHPLVLITLRPLVRFVGLFTAEKWFIAPILVVSAMSGLCVLMAWLFVKRATQKDTYAFLFAIMLGATSAHLLFGSLVETYIFGVTSLIFFLLLVQAGEKRFSVLLPAGLLVFGVTITNIAQAMIALLFNKFGFRRLVQYGMTLLAAGVVLTALVSMLYPKNQSFFFVPRDISFESRYSQPVYKSPLQQVVEKASALGRTIFLYGVVAPKPVEDTLPASPTPFIQFKTFILHDHVYAWYSGLGYIPFIFWVLLLAGALFFFFKGLKSSVHMPLMLGLLGCLVFNFVLHMNYGEEFFLYSTNWTYLLVFWTALAFASLSGRRWFESILTGFVWMMMMNNAWFIFVILRGLAANFASS